MKILVTGAKGFVGKNLCAQLNNIKEGKAKCYGDVTVSEVFEYDIDSTAEELDRYCKECDFVFNLAGVNRPQNQEEFMQGNFGFASILLDTLKKHKNACPVVLSSSIQATLIGRYDSDYGRSKKAGEELFFDYGTQTGAKVLVYRFPNLFGKWCRPNYNSAIATFCYNIANGLPIQVNDPSVYMDVLYIDDLVEEMIQALRGNANRSDAGFCSVPVHHETTLGYIADNIRSFPEIQDAFGVPQMEDPLVRKLFATYLSYLPAERFIYDLKMNCDPRGSFTEIIRTADRGQFSVNISKPGIAKGNHWHHSKNEKFVVVHGTGLIQLRRIGVQADGSAYPVHSFYVSGEKIQVVQMIPGYTHNIINLSDTEDLVTFMWADEAFDPAKPDTYFEKV